MGAVYCVGVILFIGVGIVVGTDCTGPTKLLLLFVATGAAGLEGPTKLLFVVVVVLVGLVLGFDGLGVELFVDVVAGLLLLPFNPAYDSLSSGKYIPSLYVPINSPSLWYYSILCNPCPQLFKA